MNPNIKFLAKKHAAEIIIYGDIGWDITAKEFSDELKALGDVKDITVRINSFGGDVFDGVAIYSRLIDSGANITVYIDGIAASAASVIAMAGNEIHIAEAGFVMIHNAWMGVHGFVGNAEDMLEFAEEIKKKAARLEAVSEQIAGIYQRRTGMDMDKIRQWMAAETEFNATDAMEFGFATEIFEAARLAARYDKERHNFKNPPSATLQPRQADAQRKIAEMKMRLI